MLSDKVIREAYAAMKVAAYRTHGGGLQLRCRQHAQTINELGAVMLSDKVIREAYAAMKVAAYQSNKTNPNHANSAAYTAMVASLAWVLEEPEYAAMFEAILKETTKMLGNKVTSSGT